MSYYGAPVTGPMEIPQELPSYFVQVPAPLPEFPQMKDATVGTLRLEGTLAKRLPPMPAGDLEDLSFTNSKQFEAMELMNDVRAAYGISKQYDKRSIGKAKAVARINDRQINQSETSGRQNRRKAQRINKNQEKSRVRDFARNVLGTGADIYR